MRSYKIVLVLKSDLTKEKKKVLLQTVEKLAGAKESKIEELGEKKLAYIIKKEKKGDFVAMSFDTEAISSDLEKRLLIVDDILRHLTVRVK